MSDTVILAIIVAIPSTLAAIGALYASVRTTNKLKGVVETTVAVKENVDEVLRLKKIEVERLAAIEAAVKGAKPTE